MLVGSKREQSECLEHSFIYGGGGGKTLVLTLTALLVAALMAAWAAEVAPAEAQSDDQTGRIVARRLDDGRTEFGWQPTGGARVLPTARYFPADVGHQRWLNSSPVEVGDVEIGRINARLWGDGRIEFAFTPTGGERIEPRGRYFPVDAQVGRWLRSSPITIGPPPGTMGIAQADSFSAVSTGVVHSCGLRTNGEIACWGSNSDGQGNYLGQATPPVGRFSAVSAGGEHTCGLRTSGEVACWGRNYDWQGNYIGQATPPAGRFSAVSAGYSHTCGLRTSGEIACWGGRPANVEGQFETLELPTPPAGSFSAVVAGGETRPPGSATAYACAIRAGSGAIECWGSYETSMLDAPTGSFTAISVGRHHACAIRDTGAIECWGRNDGGQTDPPAP